VQEAYFPARGSTNAASVSILVGVVEDLRAGIAAETEGQIWRKVKRDRRMAEALSLQLDVAQGCVCLAAQKHDRFQGSRYSLNMVPMGEAYSQWGLANCCHGVEELWPGTRIRLSHTGGTDWHRQATLLPPKNLRSQITCLCCVTSILYLLLK
jgi:hypothetical protein